MNLFDIVMSAPNLIKLLTTSGILAFLLTKYYEHKSERRELFAEAYKVALAWKEMLYRVRRRGKGIDGDRKLIERFHDLQEEIDFYQGIISSESICLGRSYAKFISTVKNSTIDHIKEAWATKIGNQSARSLVEEVHPNIGRSADMFLSDVRGWMAWWQIPKIGVWWRNKK